MTKVDVVMKLLHENPEGFTREELEKRTGFLHQTLTSMLNSLVHQGRVKSADFRRRSQFGQEITVYVIDPSHEPGRRGKRKRVVRKSQRKSEQLLSSTPVQDVPEHPQAFWSDIRQRIIVYASRSERKIDEARFEQRLREFEANLRELVHRFTDNVSRLRVHDEPAVSRRKLLDACHTLNMSPPKIGKLADMKVAKNQKRAMVRVYHTDVTGNESTRSAYEAVIAAFDIIEQYNEQLQGGNGAS